MSKLLLASLVALVLLSSVMLVPTLSAYADKGSDKALTEAQAMTAAKDTAEAKTKPDADPKTKADADANVTPKVNSKADLKIEQKLPTEENDHKKGRHD